MQWHTERDTYYNTQTRARTKERRFIQRGAKLFKSQGGDLYALKSLKMPPLGRHKLKPSISSRRYRPFSQWDWVKKCTRQSPRQGHSTSLGDQPVLAVRDKTPLFQVLTCVSQMLPIRWRQEAVSGVRDFGKKGHGRSSSVRRWISNK